MTFLLDAERARAYQFLCDHPTGSTRSWAAQLGWKPAKLSRFLAKLEEKDLATVETHGNYGSTFLPSRPASPRIAASRGVSPVSSAVVVNTQLDKVPRYGLTPEEEKRLGDAMRLIDELNRSLTAKFGDGYVAACREKFRKDGIPRDNLGSLDAAKRILKLVPVDRAISLVWEAGMAFQPEQTGGDLPHSLGHPFIPKYVVNEYRKIERALARGQLSLLFVESPNPPVVYGARKTEPAPASKPVSTEELARGREEYRRIANSKTMPQRMG